MTTPMSQPCEDRDFAEWHRGCPWCAVWVVWVDAPQVAQQVEQGRQALGRALLPRYARQPHITLAYRGLCGVEFGQADLRADIARLQAVGGAPFAVRLRGVDSFATVPYLAVDDEDGAALARWHGALGGALSGAQPPGWAYVPHVTLGHYAAAVPLPQAVARLRAAGVGQSLRLPVRALTLVRYATHDIAGPLWAEGAFDLETGRYAPAPGALICP